MSLTNLAQADLPPLFLRGEADYAHPQDSERGAELGVEALMNPVEDHDFEIGPHLGFLTASRSGTSRQSWYLGEQSTYWFFNVFGPGLGADWIASSSLPNNHFRIEPLFDVRIHRVNATSAMALRIGVPYEQSLRWGFLAGLTFQFNGVR
jgi:hypothetical protein